MKYAHTHTAFVEALNKILAERLFKVQDAQELNDPEKVSATWVKHLYGLVDELNNTETEIIGMKPKDAIKLNEVPLVDRERYPPEEVLPEDDEFLDNMIRSGHRRLARSFNLCYRYIDDLIVFNNKKFLDYLKEIYPSQLIVEKANKSDYLADYLDLTFIIDSER